MTSEQSFRSFLSVFFVACGWAFTRYIDRAASAPIIEYRIEERTAAEGSSLTIHLENLTSDLSFTNLVLVLRLESVFEEARFADLSPTLQELEPSWQGREPPERSSHSGTFRIPEFHPGWKFRLTAEYFNSPRRPTLHLYGSDQPVRLVQPCWETRFLRYQHYVIFFALALYLLVLIWGARLWQRLARPFQGPSRRPAGGGRGASE